MPTIAAANDARSGELGFTLIELVVVLAIISLLAAVGATAMRDRPPSFGHDRLRGELERLVATAQAAARKTAEPAVVEMKSLGEEDIAVEPAIGEAMDRIVVFADGSSTGGTITLGGKPLARLDWLTGRISDAR